MADSLTPYRLIQIIPEEDSFPTDSALVWVGYTSEELVIYARLYQGEINATSRRRDSKSVLEGSEDALKIYLQTKGWGIAQSDYVVAVNPLGTVSDRYGHGPWDGENYAETVVHPWGWEVLLRISFLTLDYVKTDWGFNVERSITYNTSRQMLVPNLKSDPKRYAVLNIDWAYVKRKRNVSVVVIPSARLQSEADEGWDGDLKKRKVLPMAGITLRTKRGIGELLDATFLPDFSDVDVDMVEFRLDRLPVNYPERRPFFVEGRTYSPSQRIVRTRNIVQPIFGVKFYSSHKRNDFYVNTLRDVFLGWVSFGKGEWRATDNLSLSSSFAVTDSSNYQVFGGAISYYLPPLKGYVSVSQYRNFPVGASYRSLNVGRYADVGVSGEIWYNEIERGYLSSFNAIALNFDDVRKYGVWMRYKYYTKLIGRTFYTEINVEWSERKRLSSGVPITVHRGASPMLSLLPFVIGFNFTYARYDYLKEYGYDSLYGISDFSTRYMDIMPGLYVSRWKNLFVSLRVGTYLGHPLRALSVSAGVSPYGFNTDLALFTYRTVLDDITTLQYSGEIPLPFNLILKPYLNYTVENLWRYSYLEGNLVLIWEPRPLTGVYLAVNKRLYGETPRDLHHLYEKEVLKVQVRKRVW